jgi:excisionase family DNA binding protein
MTPRNQHLPASPHIEQLLTTDEAAAFLRVSTGTVTRLIRSGRLKASKPGKQFLVRKADLDAYLAA